MLVHLGSKHYWPSPERPFLKTQDSHFFTDNSWRNHLYMTVSWTIIYWGTTYKWLYFDRSFIEEPSYEQISLNWTIIPRGTILCTANSSTIIPCGTILWTDTYWRIISRGTILWTDISWTIIPRGTILWMAISSTMNNHSLRNYDMNVYLLKYYSLRNHPIWTSISWTTIPWGTIINDHLLKKPFVNMTVAYRCAQCPHMFARTVKVTH